MKTAKNRMSTKAVLSGILYGLSSILIMIVNKYILTVKRFPSSLFIAFSQAIVTLAFLSGVQIFKQRSFSFEKKKIKMVSVLSLLNIANILFGLWGFREMSMTMFIVLRRFGNLLLLLGEVFFLGFHRSSQTYMSVFCMILGAVVAVGHDFSFALVPYSIVMLNNIFGVIYALYLKRLLSPQSSLPCSEPILQSVVLNKKDILWYNTVLAVPCTLLLMVFGNTLDLVRTFPHWIEWDFVLAFLAYCVLGLSTNWFAAWCTELNSPLTTSVVGVCKNILVMYLGMVYGGDYVYSPGNLLGVNISAIGAVLYLNSVRGTSNTVKSTSSASLAL